METSIARVTALHCAKHRPALTLDGFAAENYGVTARHVRRIADGRQKAPDRFLQRVAATHTRLFPAAPLVFALPDNRVVHVDEAGELSITFPKTPAL